MVLRGLVAKARRAEAVPRQRAADRVRPALSLLLRELQRHQLTPGPLNGLAAQAADTEGLA